MLPVLLYLLFKKIRKQVWEMMKRNLVSRLPTHSTQIVYSKKDAQIFYFPNMHIWQRSFQILKGFRQNSGICFQGQGK